MTDALLDALCRSARMAAESLDLQEVLARVAAATRVPRQYAAAQAIRRAQGACLTGEEGELKMRSVSTGIGGPAQVLHSRPGRARLAKAELRRRGSAPFAARLAAAAVFAGGVAAAAASGLLLAGCGKAPESNVIVGAGHVEATDVHIAAKVAGRLLKFSLQEGDAVKLGQVLAELDTTDNLLTLRQARGDRDQAAAELALRVAGSRPEDIAEAATQVASARADLDGAQKDLDRMQALLDRGSGTAKSRDDARTRRDMTAARRRGTEAALARARHGSRPQEIAEARARLAAMEAHAAALEQQIRDATVTSPLIGVVTEKVAQQGELLQPGSPLCVITDLANAWLTVYVAEPDLARIRLAQPAEVVTDDGQRRGGHITYISPEAEFTPKNVQTRDERVKLVFKVKVGLDNRDGLFKPGMPATARFQAPAKAGAPQQPPAGAGAPQQPPAGAGAPEQPPAKAGGAS